MTEGEALLLTVERLLVRSAGTPGSEEWEADVEAFHAFGLRPCRGCRRIRDEAADFGPKAGGRFGRRTECEACRGRTGRQRYTGPERQGLVYWIEDKAGRLLYVGRTVQRLDRRLVHGRNAHAKCQPWWSAAFRVRWAVYETEAAMAEAEAFAIAHDGPAHNVYRPAPPAAAPSPVETGEVLVSSLPAPGALHSQTPSLPRSSR